MIKMVKLTSIFAWYIYKFNYGNDYGNSETVNRKTGGERRGVQAAQIYSDGS